MELLVNGENNENKGSLPLTRASVLSQAAVVPVRHRLMQPWCALVCYMQGFELDVQAWEPAGNFSETEAYIKWKSQQKPTYYSGEAMGGGDGGEKLVVLAPGRK